LVGWFRVDVLAVLVGSPGRLVGRVVGRHDTAGAGAELAAAPDLERGRVDEVAPPLLVRGVSDDHHDLLAVSA
jgi:hypothetical protein